MSADEKWMDMEDLAATELFWRLIRDAQAGGSDFDDNDIVMAMARSDVTLQRFLLCAVGQAAGMFKELCRYVETDPMKTATQIWGGELARLIARKAEQ